MKTEELKSTKELVIAYMSALQERNLEKLLPMFAENPDWNVPGNQLMAPWLGKRNTKAQVGKFYELLWANTEAISGEVENMAVLENVALISGNFASRMLQTGKVFESIFFIEVIFENNKIIKYKLLEDSYGLAEALTP